MSKEYSNSIKVSVVIPVYNVELYFRQCLDSLINQTLKEIEIVLIDDCSTDSCGLICDEYAAKDNRIIVIHNENNIRQGLSRNKGIDIAKGEYIGFVDPDDWVDLDFFEKLYYTASKNKSDIVKTEYIKVYSEEKRIRQTKQNEKINNGIKKRIPLFLLFSYEHCAAIFKSEVLLKNNIKYPDIRNAQDDIFLLQSSYYAESISLISDTYYYYRQHPLSTISIREQPYFNSLLKCFDLKVEFINKQEIEKQHYISGFHKAYYSVNKAYDELKPKHNLDNFKRQYVKEIILTLNKYKYNKEDLLNAFSAGLRGKEDFNRKLEKSVTYRIFNIIRLIKIKMITLLNIKGVKS